MVFLLIGNRGGITHVPGGHGYVVESEPCGSEGAFRFLLVVVFLLLNRAVLLAGRHGTGGRVGKSGRELTAGAVWEGSSRVIHPFIRPRLPSLAGLVLQQVRYNDKTVYNKLSVPRSSVVTEQGQCYRNWGPSTLGVQTIMDLGLLTQ